MNSDKGKVGSREANERQKLGVSIQFVAVPDAEARRRRAINLILQAAARTASQSSKKSTKT